MARTHSPTTIDYPNCAKCGTFTHTVQIEPGEPGYDKRTFICYECNHSELFSSNTNEKPARGPAVGRAAGPQCVQTQPIGSRSSWPLR